MTNVSGRRKRKSRQQRMQNLMWIGGIAVLLGIALILPGLYSGVDTSDVHTYKMVNGNSIGDPNAPVKVVEFSDFRCSHCITFSKESEQTFLEEYVYTGKVYYTYRSAGAWVSEASADLAEAAYCAGDQEMFWPYHELMFSVQDSSDSELTKIAGELGLDRGQFSSCLSEDKYVERVAQDREDALAAGIQGTPGFFVNGENTNSGSNYELLKQAIEVALP